MTEKKLKEGKGDHLSKYYPYYFLALYVGFMVSVGFAGYTLLQEDMKVETNRTAITGQAKDLGSKFKYDNF